MGKHVVFVYGSLLSGLHNHGVLAGAKPLGDDQTFGLYQMRDLGYFPGVFYPGQLDHCCAIKGEVYEVDDAGLARLDLLEGRPTVYERWQVELESGRRAWIYLWQSEPCGPIVVGGDWRAYLAERILARGGVTHNRQRSRDDDDDRETIEPGDERYYRPRGTADR